MPEELKHSQETQLAVLALEVKHVVKAVDDIKSFLVNQDSKFATKEFIESRLEPLWKFLYIVVTAVVTVVVGGIFALWKINQ